MLWDAMHTLINKQVSSSWSHSVWDAKEGIYCSKCWLWQFSDWVCKFSWYVHHLLLLYVFVIAHTSSHAHTYPWTIGCKGNYFFQGIEDKARAIFDSSDANSVVSQLCDGVDALANCTLGKWCCDLLCYFLVSCYISHPQFSIYTQW